MRYRSLDVWRGLACLMLVMYHATFFSDVGWRWADTTTWTVGGLAIWVIRRLWIGVPIFFVVSGYCIAASSDPARQAVRSLRTYFSRRLRRIYPPLWAACLVATAFLVLVRSWTAPGVASRLLPMPGELSAGQWLGNLLAAESWRPQIWGGDQMFLMRNTWTLCYEEQFYAVVGLMLLASGQRFFLAAAAVTAGTLVARHLSRRMGVSLDGFFFDGHWLLFANGIAVYYALHHAHGMRRWAMIALLLVGAPYALADRRWTSSPFERHLDSYLLASSLFGLMLFGLHGRDGQLASSRWLRPLAWFGKISYSVYLTHFPVVVALSLVLSRAQSRSDGFTAAVVVPLSVALSVPLGWIFHQLVERHFLNAPFRAGSHSRIEGTDGPSQPTRPSDWGAPRVATEQLRP